MFTSPLKFIFLILSSFLFNCTSPTTQQNADPEYANEIQTWREARLESLKSETGWLNLAGLFWLKEGRNTFGASSENDLVFQKDKAPEKLGVFILNEGVVVVQISPGLQVLHNGQPVQNMTMTNDQEGRPTVLSYGSLRWYVIKRGERIGIRLRDLNSTQIAEFHGIDSFPIDATWRLPAKLIRHDPPKRISVPNIIGTINEAESPGTLEFKINAQAYRLDAISANADGRLFVVFGDRTTGKETYGGGRFLYVEKPDSTGKTVIDFNKAYNPPCVFTPFATCPLPPEQNRLPIKILAGEKTYHHPDFYN